MENIIIEFQKITKFPIIDFLIKYRNFLLNDFPEINKYFSGEVAKINNESLINLKQLTSEVKNLLSLFKNFSNKFSNCGYWELMDLIDDLNNTLEKINKLPKFKKTFLSKRGYLPYIEVSTELGSMFTIEDLANSIKNVNKSNDSWIDLMLSNDFNENDWDIDKLSKINVLISNKNDVVVTTIVDLPVGEKVYGIDMNRNISFSENDISLVKFKKNVEQKSDILLELNRGDVPENLLFGKNYELYMVSFKQFPFPEVVQDIRNNFLQNDLFESVDVKDYTFKNGNVDITVNIKTKYNYKTEKSITI